jgi:hypothetical protein
MKTTILTVLLVVASFLIGMEYQHQRDITQILTAQHSATHANSEDDECEATLNRASR